MSHCNLQFIYKGSPTNPSMGHTHTHTHIPAYDHTNEDSMIVSEIITRLACSTVGLKLTPCPHTHTHSLVHTYTQSAGPSLLRPVRPALDEYKGWWGLARHLVGHCSGLLNEVRPVAAGTGAGVPREAEAEAAAAPRRKSDNYLFLREMTALASASPESWTLATE